MKMKKQLFCILSVVATVIPSCNTLETVRGNKNTVDKEIDVSDYTKIDISVPGELVYLQTPDKAPYLQITVDENILPLLEIETAGERLKIRCRKNTNIRPSRLIVHTGSSHLSKVGVTGSGKIHLKDEVKSGDMTIGITGPGTVISDALSCEKMRLTVTGSGKIKLKGTGGEASCTVTGSGDIDVSACPVRSADCRVTGSGDVLVCAEDKLTATVAGSGNIGYRGNPPEINVRVTGSGNIRQVK
jgi:hypothetical protein